MNQEIRDFYILLGLKRFTNDQDIIFSAFQRRMFLLSDDNLSQETQKRLSQPLINAYQVLSDPIKKKDYDRELANAISHKVSETKLTFLEQSSNTSKVSDKSFIDEYMDSRRSPFLYILIFGIVLIIGLVISNAHIVDPEENIRIYNSIADNTAFPSDVPDDETSIVFYSNGDMPYYDYYGSGLYDRGSLSELSLINYSSLDAVVILEDNRGNVIRHAYIQKDFSYTMTEIPECICKVKVMFGQRWNSLKDNGFGNPKGGFSENISFSEADSSFDFFAEHLFDEISYPTYSLTLHKVKYGNTSTSRISKDSFFN